MRASGPRLVMLNQLRVMLSRPAASAVLPRLCAAVIAVLGFLPIANWIPGGHSAEWFSQTRSEWTSGTAVALGIAIVAFVVVRRVGLWPNGLAAKLAAASEEHLWLTSIALTGVFFVLYATIAREVFGGRPLLIDEIVQTMQARILAEGRVARLAAPFPEFFSALHVVDLDGKVFSQFPPGGPLMLLPGVVLGAPWLVGPGFGALSALLYWRLVRHVDGRATVALGATLVFAAAPFTAFMAGSHMNHVPTVTWLCAALYALHRVTSAARPLPLVAAVCGFSFGVMASIRPVDAAAFAVPAAIWLLVRAWRTPGAWRDVLAAGVGVAIPVVGVLWYNQLTTGDPLLFGYEMLWGKSHALGFHRAPWGVTHTPLRGLELVNLFFLRLQTYLFETPLPSLVPVVAALAITPAVRGFDRYLLWGSAFLVTGYFAYWHDGFFLGPRFFYPLLPALALWTARLPGLARDRVPRLVGADRLVLLAYLASAGIALMVSVPFRAQQYAGGLTSMRHDYTAPARRQAVEGALILVRESWGAQLITRLWALGVPRSETETLYRGIDSCLLEQRISALERHPVGAAAALDSVAVLLRDSARVRRSDVSPDQTERVLPGLVYPDICRRRIAEDVAGYTFLAPLLAVNPGSNLYARDLHARDTLLLRAFAGRQVYVLRPSSSRIGALLELVPFAEDSARAEWARTREPVP